MVKYLSQHQKLFYIFLSIIFVAPIVIHMLFSSLAISERFGNVITAFISFGIFYGFLRLLLFLNWYMYKGNLKMLRWNRIASEFFILVPILFFIMGLWVQIESFTANEMIIEPTNYGLIGVILSAYHHWNKNYAGIVFYFGK